MSIAAPASRTPYPMSTTMHRRSSSSTSTASHPLSVPGPKAVRFAPYATTSPASSHTRSLSRSRSPLDRTLSTSPAASPPREQQRNSQYLEVQVRGRSSKSPSPSALSSGSYSDASGRDDVDMDLDLEMDSNGAPEKYRHGSLGRSSAGSFSHSPSPVPRDSVSTVSETDSEASGGKEAEVLGLRKLALGGMPIRPILKPTSRRAKPPAPLLPQHAGQRQHRRAHSFHATTKPAAVAGSVGYMLCPSPLSATLGQSQRVIQAKAMAADTASKAFEGGKADAKSPVRGGFPVVSMTTTGLPSPIVSGLKMAQQQYQQMSAPVQPIHIARDARSPRSALSTRPAGLDTISEIEPVPAAAPGARRHSAYSTSINLPVHAPLHIRRTPSPSNDATIPDTRSASPPSISKSKAPNHHMSLERMMLVNPAIAAHLKRGGVVSVKSVDGSKSWKIRIPEEQLAALRLRD